MSVQRYEDLPDSDIRSTHHHPSAWLLPGLPMIMAVALLVVWLLIFEVFF